MCVCAYVAQMNKSQKFGSSVTYGKDEAVLEVGELFVALLAAVHAILFVYHLFVAVLAGTRLVKAVFLAQIHYGGYAGVVVRLKRQNKQKLFRLNVSKIFVHLDMLTAGNSMKLTLK